MKTENFIMSVGISDGVLNMDVICFRLKSGFKPRYLWRFAIGFGVPYAFLFLVGSGDVGHFGIACKMAAVFFCILIGMAHVILLPIRMFRRIGFLGVVFNIPKAIAYMCGFIALGVVLLTNFNPVVLGAKWRLHRSGGNETYARVMKAARQIVESHEASDDTLSINQIDDSFKSLGGVLASVDGDCIDIQTLPGREYSVGWVVCPVFPDAAKGKRGIVEVKSGLYRYLHDR